MYINPLWVRWLAFKGRLGSARALVKLGHICETQFGDQGVQRSNALYLKAANKGNAQAMWALGVNYLGQKGGQADADKAVYWLQQACENRHDLALWALGKMYLAGRVVPEDRERGISLLAQSAQQGCQPACLAMSDIYRNGRYGVAVDQDAARDWYYLAQPFWDRFWNRCGVKRIDQPGTQ